MNTDAFSHFGLQDCWTPVTLSARLGRQPRSIELAGQRLVLFRSGNGRPTALLDRCPHRGAALSLGRVGQDGCLQCPFHGWRFDGSGACVEVPLSDARRGLLQATTFPIVERGGLLWLYTRADSTPSDAPPVPEALEDESLHTWRTVKRWKAHWTRVMENLLDAPHLPFVHARTIGAGVKKRMQPDSRMKLTTTERDSGFHVRWSLDGKDTPAHLSWTKPNAMGLHLALPKRRMDLHVWCVAVNEEETDLIVANARDFGRFTGGRLFDQLNRVILWEDRKIVESQRPREVPHPSEEKSVALDGPTLAFRRWYLARKSAVQELPEAVELNALH